MAGISTLQIIDSIPKFDGTGYVEWSRSFNDILQISWPFLSKLSRELGRKIPLRVVMMKRGILMNVNPSMLMI